MRKLGIPCVNTFLTSDDPVLPVVYFDNIAAGRVAAEHLLERKFRYFGFCHRLGMYPSVQRREGFTQRLSEEGLECSVYDMPLYLSDPNSWIEWQVRMADWLTETDTPMKVIAFNCGFRHQQYMNAVFRKRVRKTPGQIRSEAKKGVTD